MAEQDEDLLRRLLEHAKKVHDDMLGWDLDRLRDAWASEEFIVEARQYQEVLRLAENGPDRLGSPGKPCNASEGLDGQEDL